MRQVVIDYAPRAAFLPYHNRTERFACLVAHRRAGKTVACINDLIKQALTCSRDEPRFAYIAPLYNQAKDVAWNYLKRFAYPVLASPPNESELRVDLLNGARIRLYGADNPDRLRGLYLDGVVLDEYADMHPGVWSEVLRPALADRQGGATFIGTPKGRNAFHKRYEYALTASDWFPLMLRASETGLLPQAELDAARLDMTPEQYEQEFECSFDAAIMGAYFAKEVAQAERDGRIGDFAYDPAYPVHTAWDIGVGDATAIWFWQVIGSDIRIIDYYENVGFNAQHYVAEIKSRKYNEGIAWVPHDGRQREWTSGGGPGLAKQRIETLQAHGLTVRVVPDHKIDDGINAARMTLPRCHFNEAKTANGIEILRQYRAEFDEKLQVFKNRPLHNWTSHGADAFRYMAMAWRAATGQPVKPDPIKQLLKPRTMADITGAPGEWQEDDD
jgi:phage terminase large subunit